MRRLAAALVLPGLASAAQAEVVSATPAGFEVASKVVVVVPPAEAYAALGRIGEWWNPAHSYSGSGANLSVDLRAGGCFCEKLPGGGGIEHMRVVLAWPGKMLRLSGGLGPLQGEGASGALTWTLKPVDGGTEIVQSYVVGGYIRAGADKLAPVVDQVMGEQLERLKARLAH